MACPVRYPGLPCRLSGVGFTAKPASLGLASLELQVGQGSQFPALTPGQFFFAEVTDSCRECCEVVRIVARDGDVLTMVRDAPVCTCFSSNSRVRYVSDTREAILAIAAEVPFEVIEPLVWDCETRVLRIDCAKLKAMFDEPCG